MQPLTPLNYTSHAIEDLTEYARRVEQAGMQADAGVIRLLVRLLQKAEKFLLPPFGELLDDREIVPADFHMLRMPYPVTVCECNWQDAPGGMVESGPLRQIAASRRIVLILDGESGILDPAMANIYRQHIAVIPISYIDELQRWMPTTGGCLLPYGDDASVGRMAVTELVQSQSGSLRIMGEALLASNLVSRKSKTLSSFEMSSFVLLDKHYRMIVEQIGREAAEATLWMDVHDEVRVAIGLANVLNCANVGTDLYPASPALNRKRAAAGRPPFFDYKVLTIDPRHQGTTGGGGYSGLGERASPRQHLRRGHIRHLEGRTVWVRHTMVGTAAEGVLRKDYRVKYAMLEDA